MGLWQRMTRRRVHDVDEEIATHLRMAMEARVEQGESPGEARRAAMREFGNVLMVREATRRMWGWEWMDRVGQDLRYAWRQLWRSPGFPLTVIVTLAVGLGATAAMFTVVNRVLFETMPYKDPRRLVVIEESGRKGVFYSAVPFLDLQEWRSRSRTIQEFGFASESRSIAFLDGDAASEQVSLISMSTNLFHVLWGDACDGARVCRR